MRYFFLKMDVGTIVLLVYRQVEVLRTQLYFIQNTVTINIDKMTRHRVAKVSRRLLWSKWTIKMKYQSHFLIFRYRFSS